MIPATLPDDRPGGTQGFFINTRRDKFKDPRVRQALGLTFDFEWTNKNLFYGLYKRTEGFFENSNMKAVGPPSEEELALLAPFKDQLPASVFEPVALPPKSNGSGQDRRLLIQARKLLNAAGWTIVKEPVEDKDCGWFCKLMTFIGLQSKKQANVLRNKQGQALEIEFLLYSQSFIRVISPMIRNMKTIGIQANIRLVDPAQYQERLKSFDFDITAQRYIMRLTPGVELWNMFGSRAADAQASYNLAGIKNPVVDSLIEKVIGAQSRQELITACRALDRVLRAHFYWVPHWYKASHNVAYWNKFAKPAVKPKYDRGIIEYWWYDNEKASQL